MMQRPWVLWGLLAVGGCTASADVIGKVGSEAVYRGRAVGYADGAGKIDMTAENGTQCVGNFRYVGMSGGYGRLQCSDGRIASIQFNALGMASGYGYGTTSDGKPVRFTYGLSAEEGKQYLDPPGQAKQAAGAKRGSGSGSGFFINERGQILTNEHVAGDCSRITARTMDGSSKAARLVAADKINDLAVLAIDSVSPAYASFLEVPAYRQGETVVAYGFPLATRLSSQGVLTTGTLSATSGMQNDSRFIQISAPIQNGNSGGPLADSSGTVIGVVSAKLGELQMARATGTFPQNVNFAIKDTVAKTFLQSHGVPFSERKRPADASTAVIGDAMRQYVVALTCEVD